MCRTQTGCLHLHPRFPHSDSMFFELLPTPGALPLAIPCGTQPSMAASYQGGDANLDRVSSADKWPVVRQRSQTVRGQGLGCQSV